jgi:shikimate kinase
MSGAGKTYLSQRLETMGFERVSVDEKIEDLLRNELPVDRRGLQVVANWVGIPEDPWYAERSAKYLDLEETVLASELDRLEDASTIGLHRYVLDTTGSVVYLGSRLLSRLREATTVIHLETPPRIRQEMFTAFMAKPTPLIWREPTDSGEGPLPEKASGDAFLKLIEAREKAYRALAHETLGYEERRSADFDLRSRFSAG